ncbi:MAG: hypothetical protein AB7K64_20565 [Variibacter sp.]
MTLEQFFELHRSPRAIVVRTYEDVANERVYTNEIASGDRVAGAWFFPAASKKRSR